jgi:DNA replication protein DnaC
MIQQTLGCLKEMHLSVMEAEYRRQSELGAWNGLDFEERLGLLVDAEWRERKNKKLRRLLKAACLREPGACLEELDYSGSRGLEKGLVARLSDCAWVAEGRHMLITGPCGTGKTYLSNAFANAACRRGLAVKALRVSRLLVDLQVGRGDGSWAKTLAELKKPDLLILDDFGLEGLAAVHCRDFLEVVDDRSSSKSMVLVSQLPVSSWHGVFADPTIAEAVLDRLLHQAVRFELKGPSKRRGQKPSETMA